MNLTEIEERAAKATPGPWKVYGGKIWKCSYPCKIVLKGDQIDNLIGNQSDIEFVVNAREDIPALIARVKELEEIVVKYETKENNQKADEVGDYEDLNAGGMNP